MIRRRRAWPARASRAPAAPRRYHQAGRRGLSRYGAIGETARRKREPCAWLRVARASHRCYRHRRVDDGQRPAGRIRTKGGRLTREPRRDGGGRGGRSAAPVGCVLVAGFPSSGKSAVVKSIGRQALRAGRRPALAALECFPSEPRPAWTTDGARPIPWRSWTSGDTCPDHALADLLGEMRDWAAGAGADLLLVESAGLCCRCSPYPTDGTAVFVADASAGRGALRKVGPMLTTCDVCVLTRPDRITPAERDADRHGARAGPGRC